MKGYSRVRGEALGYEPEGREFESLRARHIIKQIQGLQAASEPEAFCFLFWCYSGATRRHSALFAKTAKIATARYTRGTRSFYGALFSIAAHAVANARLVLREGRDFISRLQVCVL